MMMEIEIYKVLVEYGFSPQKAGEIALDHERGDKYATAFIDLARAAIAKAEGAQE
jgi:hypothetical protein